MEHKKVIKNTSHNQHEILHNIMVLHNNSKPYECDITYSKGKFYGIFKINGSLIEIPQPKYKFDVSPVMSDVVKIEPMGKLPLDDNSVESIVIDLPFVIAPKNSASIINDDNTKKRNIIFKRFSSFYPVSELLESYSHWINEAYRVLKENGICVFKCQNTISSSTFYCTEEYSWMEAQKCGFYVQDKFILCAKQRIISGKIKNQQHARNYTSVFWVFRKGGKHKTVNYYKHLNK